MILIVDLYLNLLHYVIDWCMQVLCVCDVPNGRLS